MSRMDTRKLSHEARVLINDVIREWLRNTQHEIGEVCIVSEIFNSRKKNAVVCEFRKRLHTHLRERIRVRYRVSKPKTPENMEVALSSLTEEREGWVMPSLPLLGAMLGVDHSGLVPRKKAEPDK